MAILQPIHNIAEICARKGVRNAILCPGSRSAALTISMVRHPEIQTYSISDERSAGFIGLGMAQQTNETVALICTSGTAAYNFAPSITEAFFQEIPLLILTADRPPEWVHQYDGQTIYQREIYGKHVKKSFELPSDYSHPDALWQIERVINEAINLTQITPKGPVHINIPIREPFYPTEIETITFDRNVRIIRNINIEKTLSKDAWQDIHDIWRKANRKLIVVCHQQGFNLSDILQKLSDEFNIPIIGGIISNISFENKIDAHDIFLSSKNDDFLHKLQPDLLITCGKSVISKNLKLFIRKYPPHYHFHIQENEELIDPFQTLTHKLTVSSEYFFGTLFNDLDIVKFREGDEEEDETYLYDWHKANAQARIQLHKFLGSSVYCEFKVVQTVLENLPNDSILHLANSMPVRYANLVGLGNQQKIEVFANRGTSGIEGTLSSAVGCAIKTTKIVICLIGDVSFFYDRNALWNNYLPENLRIIMLNNKGGNIFKIIDGPNRQPEADKYFVTEQMYSAQNSSIDARIEYKKIDTDENLKEIIPEFFLINGRPKMMEIELDGEVNVQVFDSYKKLFAKFS